MLFILVYSTYRNCRVVSRGFFTKISPKISHAAYSPATRKNYLFRFRQKVNYENRRVPLPAKQRWRNDLYRRRNYAYFIDFMPFFGQQMSYHRRRCPARGWIVTRTSYHAGFWCLSLLKRSTKSRRRMGSDESPI